MSDTLAGGAWAAVTGFLFFAAWRVVIYWLPHDDVYQKALHTLILAWAMVVAGAVLLGTVNELNGMLLLGVIALESFGLLVSTCFRLRNPRFGLVFAITVPERETVACGIPQRERTKFAEATLWLFLLCFLAYHLVCHGLLKFPDDFDSLMYHLPLIDHWLQAGSLYAPDAWQWSTPGNNELIGLWCVAPFSGDFWSGLTNTPAVLVLALASRELALVLGIRRMSASVGAVAVVANYVVLNQLVDAENDVAVAALTLTSAAYALRFCRDGHGFDLVLGGISMGLLAGIKFYALGYAGFAWFLLFGTATARRGLRVGVLASLAAAGLTLGWGGYWYLRNWFVTGAPLYPKRLFAAGDELARYYPEIARTSFFGNGSPELFPLAMEAVWKMTGPLHLAALYCLPLTVGWLIATGVVLWRSPLGRFQGISRVGLGCLTLAAAVVLVCTPFAVEDEPGTLNQLKWASTPVRYAMSFLSLVLLTLVVFLSNLAKLLSLGLTKLWKWKRAQLIPIRNSGWTPGGLTFLRYLLMAMPSLLLLGLSAIQLLKSLGQFKGESMEWGLFAIDGTLLGIILLWFGSPFWRRPRMAACLAWAMVIAGAVVYTSVLSARWHGGFARFYERTFGESVFADLAAPATLSETICVLDFRPYPFFGSRRQHRVCQPHGPHSASEFYDYLLGRDVNLLVARFDMNLSQRGWESCQLYIAQNPELFTPAKNSIGPYALFLVRLHHDTATVGD